MSYTLTCPDCGAIRPVDHHHGVATASRSAERDVRFAQVLNGYHWREKPERVPRERDDIVPND